MQFYRVADKAIIVPEGSVVAMTQSQVKRNAFGLRYLEPEQVDEVLGKAKGELGDYHLMEVIASSGKVHFVKDDVFGVPAALATTDGLVPVDNPKVAVDAAKIAELKAQLAALEGKN